MKMRFIPLLIGLGLLVIAPAAGAVPQDPAGPTPKVVTENGIPHISGGVGEDEFRAVELMARQFNLKVLMATKDGSYLSDVAVAIADGKGNKVVDAIAEGPLLYTNLPPGKYLVSASNDGETRQQRVDVGRGQREVRLYW